MVSWKLAKVSKVLATAVMIGTFLPTSIALASEAEDEKAAVSATSSSETEDKKVETSAASSPETEEKKAEVQPTSSSETDTESEPETIILPEIIPPDGKTNAFALLDHFVTAERIPTSRWDTPSNVTIITSQEIEANHYQSIAEAVNHVNGVFALMDGIALSGTNRTLILVDGRRANVTPSMKAIERIEIVKGGGSALYGSDAVGGVINIITKKGDHAETTFDYSAGSWHTQRFDITNQGNDGRLGWFIAGSIYKSRPYNHKGSEGKEDLLSDHADDNVTVRLDHRFDDRNSVTFDLMHHTKEYNQYDQYYKYSQFFPQLKYREKNNPDNLTTWNIRNNSSVYLKPFSNVANDVAVTYNFKEGSATPGFLRYFRNYQSWSADDVINQSDKGNERLQGVDYQNGWEFGQHKLIAGLEWHQGNSFANYRLYSEGEYSTGKYSDLEYFDNRKVTNSAYYLQDTISLGNKWTLVPGVRFDQNSSFGHQWSPKFAANYRSDEKTKIYATWGRVYQAPGVSELYTDKRLSNGERNSSLIYGNNDMLQPETGHTETIGIEHAFSEKSRINFNLFNSKISHIIDIQDHFIDNWEKERKAQGDLQYINAREYSQRGVELSFAQEIDKNWNYEVGYAYTHRGRSVGEEVLLTHFKLPKNSFKTGIHYGHGIWKANLLAMLSPTSYGGHYVPNNFAALDFNISCDVAEFATIYAKFLNFTNQGYSYYGDVNEKVKHEHGRAVIFGVDCKL